MPKKYREVRAALRAHGWSRARRSGSHETWVSAAGDRIVTVAGKDSDTVPVGTLAAIRRATGIEHLR
ncbi:MAG: type II toxin-antitoxin system HicA family toxin [Solirubrobacterales bacterium]|nr:type II toxin-antitoxin system HicA family toxin [Solirubrobacterales bacterium]